MNNNELESAYSENPNIGRISLSKLTGVSEKRCRTFLEGKRKTIKTNDIKQDIQYNNIKSKHKQSESKYKHSISIIEELQNTIDDLLQIKNAKSQNIRFELKSKTNKSEAVPVVLFSDWHIEKTVKPESVNYRNFYTLDEAERTVKELFKNALYLVNKESKFTHISQMIVGLLGDLMDGYIHEENLMVNSLSPIESSIKLLNILESGFQYLLDNSDLNIVVPCVYGNHSRNTDKMMFSCGYKTNYEYLVYSILAQKFQNNKRISFIIPKSSETIVNVLGHKIRFYHGFNIKFNGGIGGITIPLNKAIARANTFETVDLDCLGHFHTYHTSNNFIINGSAIGFDSYAMQNKLPFEEPSQTFFLMDKDNKRTVTAPIYINREKLI